MNCKIIIIIYINNNVIITNNYGRLEVLLVLFKISIGARKNSSKCTENMGPRLQKCSPPLAQGTEALQTFCVEVSVV